jgi:FkbM family methyltransferase
MILTSILDALTFCHKIGRDWPTRFQLLQQAIRRGLAVRNPSWYAQIVAEQTTHIFNVNLPNPVQLHLRTQDMPMLFEIFKREDYRLDIEKSLSESAIVVDLGANIGLASVFFQQNYYPNARFIAVEPSPKNLAILQKNLITAVPKAEIAPVVISDKAGLVRIDDDEVGFNVHIIKEKSEKLLENTQVVIARHEATEGVFSELKIKNSKFNTPNSELDDATNAVGTEVLALPMSKIMEDLQISHIDLLKMDIEGAEKAVLRDAAAWLPKVRVLVVELHGDYSEADLRSDIEPFGFQVSKTRAKHLYFAKRRIVED